MNYETEKAYASALKDLLEITWSADDGAYCRPLFATRRQYISGEAKLRKDAKLLRKLRKAKQMNTRGIRSIQAMQAILDEVSQNALTEASSEAGKHLPHGTGLAGRNTWATIAANWVARAEKDGILTHADIFDHLSAEVLACSANDPADIERALLAVAGYAVFWSSRIRAQRAQEVTQITRIPVRRG